MNVAPSIMSASISPNIRGEVAKREQGTVLGERLQRGVTVTRALKDRGLRAFCAGTPCQAPGMQLRLATGTLVQFHQGAWGWGGSAVLRCSVDIYRTKGREGKGREGKESPGEATASVTLDLNSLGAVEKS